MKKGEGMGEREAFLDEDGRWYVKAPSATDPDRLVGPFWSRAAASQVAGDPHLPGDEATMCAVYIGDATVFGDDLDEDGLFGAADRSRAASALAPEGPFPMYCPDCEGDGGDLGVLIDVDQSSGDLLVATDVIYDDGAIEAFLSGRGEWPFDVRFRVPTDSASPDLRGLSEFAELVEESAGWTSGKEAISAMLEDRYGIRIEPARAGACRR